MDKETAVKVIDQLAKEIKAKKGTVKKMDAKKNVVKKTAVNKAIVKKPTVKKAVSKKTVPVVKPGNIWLLVTPKGRVLNVFLKSTSAKTVKAGDQLIIKADFKVSK